MRIIGGIAGLAVVATVVVAGPVLARGSEKANMFVAKLTGGLEVPPAEPTASAGTRSAAMW